MGAAAPTRGGRIRGAIGYGEQYAYLLHDRDSIFSAEADQSIQRLGLRVLKSPRSLRQTPCVNACSGPFAEDVSDWLIPLSEAHLRQTLRLGIAHYNRGRPHSDLGPGVPDPPANLSVPFSKSPHRLDDFHAVHAKAILGGLHHEYSLART
jgi:hypothetical protein